MPLPVPIKEADCAADPLSHALLVAVAQALSVPEGLSEGPPLPLRGAEGDVEPLPLPEKLPVTVPETEALADVEGLEVEERTPLPVAAGLGVAEAVLVRADDGDAAVESVAILLVLVVVGDGVAVLEPPPPATVSGDALALPPVEEPTREGVAEADAQREAEEEALVDAVTLPLRLGEGEVVLLRLPAAGESEWGEEALADLEGEPLAERVPPVRVGIDVALSAVALTEGLWEALGEIEGVRDREALPLGVLAPSDCVPVADANGDAEGRAEALPAAVGEGVPVAMPLAVADTEGDALALRAPERLVVLDATRLGVPQGEVEPLDEPSRQGEGVALQEGDSVGLALPLGTPLTEAEPLVESTPETLRCVVLLTLLQGLVLALNEPQGEALGLPLGRAVRDGERDAELQREPLALAEALRSPLFEAPRKGEGVLKGVLDALVESVAAMGVREGGSLALPSRVADARAEGDCPPKEELLEAALPEAVAVVLRLGEADAEAQVVTDIVGANTVAVRMGDAQGDGVSARGEGDALAVFCACVNEPLVLVLGEDVAEMEPEGLPECRGETLPRGELEGLRDADGETDALLECDGERVGTRPVTLPLPDAEAHRDAVGDIDIVSDAERHCNDEAVTVEDASAERVAKKVAEGQREAVEVVQRESVPLPLELPETLTATVAEAPTVVEPLPPDGLAVATRFKLALMLVLPL